MSSIDIPCSSDMTSSPHSNNWCFTEDVLANIPLYVTLPLSPEGSFGVGERHSEKGAGSNVAI